METIRTIGEIIPVVKLGQQELNQSPSVRYHIHGKDIDWGEDQIECFWEKEFINSMKEVEPGFIVDERNKNILSEMYNYVW